MSEAKQEPGFQPETWGGLPVLIDPDMPDGAVYAVSSDFVERLRDKRPELFEVPHLAADEAEVIRRGCWVSLSTHREESLA